jgi:pimeloyl-ACP methyl ester carboxylesterase
MSVLTCRNHDVEIAYETFGERGEPLLLIMALGVSRLLWHEDFCAALVEKGYHVARFDNRDSGLSSRVDADYTLRDMAADACAVLDALGWPKAHVVGASLGGMIGQVMAVHHADRVRSLTSMSSAPCHKMSVSRPKLGAILKLIRLGRPKTREAAGEHIVNVLRITGTPGGYSQEDENWLRTVGETQFDYGSDPKAYKRQIKVIREDRRAELARVTAPTLVVHGEADPMQSVGAGQATAAAIPNARLVTFPGMGHDLPRALWPAIIEEIGRLREETTGGVVGDSVGGL